MPAPETKPTFLVTSRRCLGGARKSNAAKAACAKMLAGIALDYEQLPPIKEGICGAPAPILVKSIGSDPTVAIEPPATMNCTLAAGLDAWLEGHGPAGGRSAWLTRGQDAQHLVLQVPQPLQWREDQDQRARASPTRSTFRSSYFASGERVTVLDRLRVVRCQRQRRPRPPRPRSRSSERRHCRSPRSSVEQTAPPSTATRGKASDGDDSRRAEAAFVHECMTTPARSSARYWGLRPTRPTRTTSIST